MTDEIFDSYGLPPNDPAPAPPLGGAPAPQTQAGYDPAASSYGSQGVSPGYDPSINLEDELKELDRGRERMTAQYSRVPKGKGEILARIAGPLGIAALGCSSSVPFLQPMLLKD
ncbi:MAG: hypothetical protein U9R75_09555 [Candidatus Thermoplasmatota archaeon]|nr:hypothetical protein [Candidatus Thermoplasmatota archaeon]